MTLISRKKSEYKKLPLRLLLEQGCGKYLLIDSTQRYNLAGEGCRNGYNGELVRIDSLSQQNYI